MNRPPVIVSSRTDFATTLRGDREALGLSGEELDEIVGWPDRYTAKVENPDKKRWGRTVFRMEPMADWWLKGLNRSLLLVDTDVAEQMVREHAALQNPESRRLARVRVVRMAIGY